LMYGMGEPIPAIVEANFLSFGFKGLQETSSILA